MMSEASFTARSALGAVLGGKQPESVSLVEFERMIREAARPTEWNEETGYDDSANYTARLVLEMYERYPQTQQLAEHHEYLLKNPNDRASWVVDSEGMPVYLTVSLYDVFKKVHSEEDLDATAYSISGFQWGWAVNAARRILRLGSMPNPALMTIQIERNDDEHQD